MEKTKQAKTKARAAADVAALNARIAAQNHSSSFFDLARKAIDAEQIARKEEG